MSRIKRVALTLMISGALLNIAPVATAAEPEPAQHCFIVDHPVVCLVVCTVQYTSLKPCLQLTCNPDLPGVCYVLGEVWNDIVP